MHSDTDRSSMTFQYHEVMKKGKPFHDKYDDFSRRHPAMPLERRAKIFSPFDALKGFHEAIAAQNVQYEGKRELSEEDARKLNLKLTILHQLTRNSRKARDNLVTASVTYFVPCTGTDDTAGTPRGNYETVTGVVYRVDAIIQRKLILDDIEIPIDDIISIECDRIDETSL